MLGKGSKTKGSISCDEGYSVEGSSIIDCNVFAEWESDMKSAFNISNCKSLPVSEQQKYVKRFTSSAFWGLLKHRIDDTNPVFPPEEELVLLSWKC